MAEKWFDDLPDNASPADDAGVYLDALAKVKAGLARGLDFETSAARVDIPDHQLRESVLDEVLKALLAEEHFAKKIPLEQISGTLNLPLERIEKALREMLEDVEESAIASYYKNVEHGTEH